MSVGSAAAAPWARDWLDEHGLPDPSAEPWRYTPLVEITDALALSMPGSGTRSVTEGHADGFDAATLDRLAARHGAVRIVFVDGRFSPELSDSPSAPGAKTPIPPGVRVGPLSDLMGPGESGLAELLGRWSAPRPEDFGPDDGFRVLNAGATNDPAVVMVSPGVAVGSPIHVVHVRTADADGGSTLSQPATVIDVGGGASCRVIESHVSLGTGLTNAVTRIRTGVDSHLHHVRIQDDHLDGAHVGDTLVEQHRGSHLKSISVNLGATAARNGIEVDLGGEHATAELSGLSLLAGTQRCDTVLHVAHRVPNCTSSQDFRGIVDDHAHSAFCGHVLVAHGAAGTDSSQSNRNLVLARTAQADTRPWLEILADDVKCTHGATVGRLDDASLFYMRSRGIPEQKAESMLVGAFAAEVIDAVDPPSLRASLYARIDRLDAGAHD